MSCPWFYPATATLSLHNLGRDNAHFRLSPSQSKVCTCSFITAKSPTNYTQTNHVKQRIYCYVSMKERFVLLRVVRSTKENKWKFSQQKMWTQDFWEVALCSFVGTNRRFRKICCDIRVMTAVTEGFLKLGPTFKTNSGFTSHTALILMTGMLFLIKNEKRV